MLPPELSPKRKYPRATGPGRFLSGWKLGDWMHDFAQVDAETGTVWSASTGTASLEPVDSFSIEEAGTRGCLVSGTKNGTIIEFVARDRDPKKLDEGRKVWEYVLPDSTHAVKLPEGHVLVGARGRVLTVDRAGKVVAEFFSERTPFRVRPCLGLVRLGFEVPARLDADLDVLLAHRLKGLKSDDPLLRQRSAELLGALGPQGAETIPELTAALKDPGEGVRGAAKVALKKVGAEDLPKYLEDLKDDDPKVRARAIDGLEAFDRLARQVVPVLVPALKDRDPKVRLHAAHALGRMKLEAEEAVRALNEVVLRDEDSEVRYYAISSLGYLGPKAKVALPTVLEALNGKELKLRRAAVKCLGHWGPVDKVVVPTLVRALKDPDLYLSRDALEALGLIGPEAKEALPTLLEMLEALEKTAPVSKADEYKLSEVIGALGFIGAEAKDAVPILVRILETENMPEGPKKSVVWALGRIGPAARAALPALDKLLEREDYFAVVAADAVERIGASR
jgi:HEAT repeat protein